MRKRWRNLINKVKSFYWDGILRCQILFFCIFLSFINARNNWGSALIPVKIKLSSYTWSNYTPNFEKIHFKINFFFQFKSFYLWEEHWQNSSLTWLMVIYQMTIKDDFTFFWQECCILSRGIRIRIQTFLKCWIRIRFRESAFRNPALPWRKALSSFVYDFLVFAMGEKLWFPLSDIVPDWGEKVDYMAP